MNHVKVVIPVKDHVGLTENLLKDLVRDGHDDILVIDNGSRPGQYRRLEKACADAGATILDMAGASIHQMWNRGVERSSGEHVAILNNDIRLDPQALWLLAAKLDEDDTLDVVCPAYDHRTGRGVLYTDELCLARYDGTGGLAGFAMMLRSEFAATYRFPEELRWWWGDADLLLTVLGSGRRAGIVLHARCEHVDGGGQTGRWEDPRWERVLQADRAAFHAKWGRVLSRQPVVQNSGR